MQLEFKLAYISILLLGAVIAVAQLIGGNYLTALIGMGLLGLGGFMVAFGFWGADYAFSVALGDLDQSRQGGKVKGERGKVYVPFMRNYTPTEWWNLNWFVITVGLFCFGFGAYFLGLVLGRLGI
jgi:hypothetical protein